MQPKSGGTLKFPKNSDVSSLDPYKAGGTAEYLPSYLTSTTLIRFEPGYGKRASGKIIGGLVKTWELPDPQTIVFHLDPAAKFDSRQPTNGRAVTAEDVVQSWKRFAKDSVYRVELSNAANKSTSVVDMQAVDASTVRVTLARPDSLALPLIASPGTGLVIQSTEGLSGKFDLTKEIRGHGPFLLDKYIKSVGFTFKRNPDWHLGGGKKPYVDEVSVPFLGDPVQADVQFRSKNLHFGAVSSENVAIFAKELKDTQIIPGTVGAGGAYVGFSYLPGQPWHDVRVRRALSMTIDRDKFAELNYNTKLFAELGVKLNTYWNNPLSAGNGDYWLDPKGKDLGSGAAWLKYNIAEAKKLLDAAGYTTQKPLLFDMVYPGTNNDINRPVKVQMFAAMALDAGIKMNDVPVDYATEYIPKYFRGKAAFEGKRVKEAAEFAGGSGGADPLVFFNRHLHTGGTSPAVGTVWPQTDEMLNKARATLDYEARKQAIQEFQRYASDNVIILAADPIVEPTDISWKGLNGFDVQVWPGGPPGGLPEELWFEKQI